MARKRKRRVRAGVGRPWLVLALAALAVAVIWAILPHGTTRRIRTSESSLETPAAPRVSVSQATAKPLPEPQSSVARTESPASTSTPAPSQAPSAQQSRSPLPASGTQVAIIIDDCGQWPAIERGYLALPIALTLSVMPHERYTHEIAREAQAASKGVMLHLPMEPLSHVFPGRGEVKADMADAQIVAQTEDDLAQVPLAAGVNNHEGSAGSADARVMRLVMGVVKAHGLFFIDSRTNAASVAAATAASDGVPNASRDVFLDNVAEVAATKAQLDRVVAVAKAHGSAIAIGHPRPSTLEALGEYYPKMQAEGVQFVLASSLVR